MKKIWVLIIFFAASASVYAFQWTTYTDDDFGFKMLIPKGANTKEWSKSGWGGIHAMYEKVHIWGVAKKGEEKRKVIEKFGVKVSGIADNNWKLIDEGSGDGWDWYIIVKASDGRNAIYAGYGVGKGNSYLLLLKTTVADHKKNKNLYNKWYESLSLK